MSVPEPKPKTIAEKLDLLFRTVKPAGREFTNAEVARAINANSDGTTISVSYLSLLRNGHKTNPSVRLVEALATFFGVPPAYFFDDRAAENIAAQLDLLAALQSSDVRDIATRSNGLSADALRMIRNIVEDTRRLEGLDDS